MIKALSLDPGSKEPVFLVSYEERTNGDTPERPSLKSTSLAQRYTYASATQNLLSKLLELNRRRVDRWGSGSNTDLSDKKVSFLLPLNPLSMRDIGSLTNDSGICAICGKKANTRCARCQSVTYCGKGCCASFSLARHGFLLQTLSLDCQTSDWKAHKDICRSLAQGTWQMIPFTDKFQGMVMSSLQSTTTATDLRKSKPKNPSTVKNIHGEKPFIVKIQIAGFDGPSMLIYDRQRSFHATYLREDDPDGFQRLAEIIHRGILGLKAYRWAKFVEGEKINVCIDVEPKEDIQW